MFSQTVEYALRAIVFLASQHPEPCRTGRIAEATQVPAAYLTKVLRNLQAAGLVRLQRGATGGVHLIVTPEDTTILDIVNAVDPIERIHTCPLGLEAHGTHLCALHARMDCAIANMEAAFAETTLTELLSDPNPSVPLCDLPGLHTNS